jgi:hypothetical protein
MEGDWGNLQVHARFLDENYKASRLVNGMFAHLLCFLVLLIFHPKSERSAKVTGHLLLKMNQTRPLG